MAGGGLLLYSTAMAENTQETAMSAEEMNKTGDLSKFCDMGKVSLVTSLKF
jgi:hypothetical protein